MKIKGENDSGEDYRENREENFLREDKYDFDQKKKG